MSEGAAKALITLLFPVGLVFWVALPFIVGYSGWVLLGGIVYFVGLALIFGLSFGPDATRSEVIEDLSGEIEGDSEISEVSGRELVRRVEQQENPGLEPTNSVWQR